MADYICRNCGHMQCSSGTNGGCAYTFWFILLIITIFIGLFAPIAFVVVAFEVLFLILTSRNPDSNYCFQCKARNCVVALDSPAGQQLYKTFYPNEYEAEKQKEEQERQRKEEEAQAREEAGLSYLDKFQTNDPKIWQITGFVILAIIVIGLICYSIDFKQEQIKTPQAQAQQQAKPENKPQKLTQTECKKLYNTTLQNYSIDKQANKETEIDDYYTKCADFAPQEKQSYLALYYFRLGSLLSEQHNYNQAIPYYKKALEANLKSSDKINILFYYYALSDCYFYTWQMEEAKKYALLAVKEKQKTGKIRVGLVDYERLGDICYNLKQYEEAGEYYDQALMEIDWLESLPDNQNYEDIQELEQKREKIISIVQGTAQ